MNNSGLGHVVGIDYSMTCPCICVFPLWKNKKFEFSKCWFMFQHVKEMINVEENMTQRVIPKKFDSPASRWDTLSENVVNFIARFQVDISGIEDYSFGSISNNNFQVGENTGVLKHKLLKDLKIVPNIVDISVIKKFAGAEGGGNANKIQLFNKFTQDEPAAVKMLEEVIGIKISKTTKNKGKVNERVVESTNSPISDIIDSYYLTKYIYTHLLPT